MYVVRLYTTDSDYLTGNYIERGPFDNRAVAASWAQKNSYNFKHYEVVEN